MKSLLALLALTTALGAATSGLAFTAPLTGNRLDQNAAPEPHFLLIDSDEEDDQGCGGDDDDDDDEGDDDEGDDDDGGCGMNGQRNPAPQGSTTPRKNGLFGNGTAPKVITN